MAYQAPRNVGDTHPLIPAAKRKLAGNSYGKAIGDDRSVVYTEAFGAALIQYGKNVHDLVLAGRRPGPDVNVEGIFDWAIQRQMELTAPPAPPAPPRDRALAYVWRGTGGIIGQDLVSLVCQGVADLVDEVNPPWAATMGGIPVGVAGGIGDPSMWSAVQATLAWTQTDFIARHKVNPKIRVVIGGYSAGAIAAAMFRAWLLENFPDNYVCSFSLGDPTRPFGGGFFGRPAPWGRGISTISYGDPSDFRHCWLTHEGDMYAQIPGGVVGDIMDDVYEEVTRFAFRDIAQVAVRMLNAIPTIAGKAGISLPGAFAALAGGPAGLVGFGLPLLISSIGGFIPTGNADQLTGTAAAAKAATIGLQFLFAGTAPHIRYHIDEAWPGGPTFLDLARQHVRDWTSRPAA
ncbi:lysin B [Mycobacterium phage Jolene]|uniref:Lysin B n=1 Tax=Mycobacterium phage Rabbs TaxID=2530143 RepID=A0A481VSZ4_9CAUD|nr:lysin B [Mycobacterium phage Sneeze]YP_010051373.1 lysin B [Mycobacterium phage Rabbs]ASZ72755.1 lysin B [Mycobacterium phage Aroostook]ATN88039.1 lysin B [Mycobacterium phage Chance64]QGH76279.1 lysin B [Mycobacterium phage Jonghyun]QYW01332.1 lysin B [Mycobacterium phage Jolene]ANU79741.1 lysin B [Mycobacterium phage Sneeze]